MASLGDLRTALADAMSSISGLKPLPEVMTSPPLPAAYIVPESGEYHIASTSGAPADWHFIIELQVAMVSDIGSQKLLDQFLSSSGTQSIKVAVETDRTLGGVAQDVVVQGFRDYGMFARAQGDTVLGARLAVWVIA